MPVSSLIYSPEALPYKHVKALFSLSLSLSLSLRVSLSLSLSLSLSQGLSLSGSLSLSLSLSGSLSLSLSLSGSLSLRVSLSLSLSQFCCDCRGKRAENIGYHGNWGLHCPTTYIKCINETDRGRIAGELTRRTGDREQWRLEVKKWVHPPPTG